MAQLDLFTSLDQQSPQPQPPPRNGEDIDGIGGFRYIEDYINDNQHDWLLNQIDKNPWLEDLKRRVQHYGFKYDYKARKVNYDMRIGHLPECCKHLVENYTKMVTCQQNQTRLLSMNTIQDKEFPVTLIANRVLQI